MRDVYNKMSRIFFVYRDFNICYSIKMSRGRTCKKQVLSHLVSKGRSCKESKMDDYNCVDYPRNRRTSKRERDFVRRERTKKLAEFVEEAFGNETHLTKELILERLESEKSVYSFNQVMRFLCKQGRVLRGF